MTTRSDEPVLDLAILGAGPVGLEAAAAAREIGWSTLLLEAGEVAEHVRRWGSVRLFSPFGLNRGPAGGRALSAAGISLPSADEILSGHELRERYLLPLSRILADDIGVRCGARVVSVSRANRLKSDAPGSPVRADEPFRLLVERDGGEEEWRARRIFDCTGTYGQPNWAGPGGTPARGERALRTSLRYHLPDLDQDRDRFARGRTLLIGGGHSAATMATWLADLAGTGDGGFVWATRRVAPTPLERISGDPLPERDRLIERANEIALDPPPGSAWLAGCRLAGIERSGSAFRVELDVGGVPRVERFDHVAALVGYEPADSLYRELQVHECYASRAPMKLAAALLSASDEGPADCLDGGGFGPEALRNPEPDFFILGAKSYGKGSAFLMRTGYEQVADAISLCLAASRAD